ncbi:MAG: transporter substrate-binding domain-containing protein, partial [Lachnospiraceae bacterium]|nr:transporter substrate-binding domain-containing protein [Lachnospiraceae bacterium]
MKKLLSLSMVVLMVLSLAACGKKESADVAVNAELSHPSASEQEVNDARAKQEKRSSASSKITYYDDINTLILALKNGKINLAYLGESVARYVMSKDETMGYVKTEYSLPNEYALCMREEDIQLINSMNEAIKAMKADGTLKKLADENIEAVINGSEPQVVSLPKVDGRRTIVVAITGDIPPMDYISKDGTAAGFNVALLKELSDRCDINVELSLINAQARAASLMSG